ncbi:MAG TPA: glycosyltransferase family 4 protein, partial [Terriglobales bacterium]|nr:glycosyltransferase family 4 protein [Terriglobales bacterium]
RRGLPANVVVRDTVPRQELYGIFDRANVLVFPTLAEGLALTPLQAMARGLPVITTPNSGAGNFIRNGENGWMIPPCNEDALARAMALCCEDPSSLEEMGSRAAQQMSRWRWSDYRAALGAVVSEFLRHPQGATEIEVQSTDLPERLVGTQA